MKKIFGLISFCSLFALFSCTDEEDGKLMGNQPISKVVIEGHDFKPESVGRTILDIDENTGSFKWVENDTLGIFPFVDEKQVGYQVAFPLVDFTSEDAGTAIFTGGGWALVTGTQYVAYYPFSYNNRDLNSISVSYLNQRQKGNNNMDHFGQFDYMYASNKGPEDNSVKFSFSHLGTLLILKLTMPEAATLTSVQLVSSGEETFTTEGHFDLSASNPSIVATQKSKAVTLGLNNIEVNANDVVTLYVCAAPFELNNEYLSIKLFGTEKWYQWNREPRTSQYLAETYYTFTETDAPDAVYDIWDGETPEEDLTPEQDGNYIIRTARQLAQFAKMVNEGNSFKDKTVSLANDIDLNGNEWIPIGYTGTCFEGTFDGGNNSISNFKITKKHHYEKNTQNNQAAFFGVIRGNATLKNFTINEAKILYPESETGDFYGAAVVGTCYGTHTFENIHVTNSTIQGNNKVAGLLAHDGSSKSITIKDCHVSGCTIETKNENDGGNVAGLVGLLQTKGVVIENSSVKGNTINAINSTDEGKRANSQFVGAIKGGNDELWLTITNSEVSGNNYNETGRVNYVSPYGDGSFVGGVRESVVGTVIINGVTYPIMPIRIQSTGKGYNTLDEALADATGGDVLNIAEGEYVFPSQLNTSGKPEKKLTFVGEGEDHATVLSFNSTAGVADGGLNCYADNMDLVFENLKVVSPNTGSAYTGGFGRAKSVTFNGCVFMGQYRAVSAVTTFDDCYIDPQASYIYTDYADATFTDCRFSASEGKAIQVFNDGNQTNTTITISGCTFTAAKQGLTYDKKPVTAIDINSNGEVFNVNVSETTATGFGTGQFSGSDLWNIKGGEQYVNLTIDGVKYVSSATALANSLTADEQNIHVVLTTNIDLPITSLGQQTGGSGEYKLGGENTQSITIDLNQKKLNITTSYWSAIGANNDDATITIKNGTMTSTGNSAGTWNAWDVRFCNCNYEIENVVFEKAVALDNAGKTAHLKGVTIKDTHNVDTYALWITAEGQTVTLDEECFIDMLACTDGRGIKIDEQYVESPQKVTLKVSSTTFATEEKAAILVKSSAGADITLSNLNISQVAEDTEYAVWCDEDAAAHFDKISVTGGKLKLEGTTPVAEGVILNKAGEYEISSKAGLLWLAGEVAKDNRFTGKIVKLTDDIDLGNEDWIPIGNAAGDYYTHNFEGTFDGNSKTISNLSVINEECAGLFGTMCKGTIKNLTINGANLTTNHYAGAIVAWMEQGSNPLFVMENCHVKGVEITVTPNGTEGNYDNGDKAGGLVGFIYGGTIKDCSATELNIKAYRDLGGIVGYVKNTTITNSKVENATLTIDQVTNYYGDKAVNVGEIIGRRDGTPTESGNTFTGVSIETVTAQDGNFNKPVNGGDM